MTKEVKEGGYRKRIAPKYAEQAMLTAIINYYEGPSAVGALIGVRDAVIINYRSRGKVALARVAELAKALNVAPWALCYPDWKVTGEKVPTWKKVVDSVAFLPPKTRKIIKEMPLMCENVKKRKYRA